MEPHAEKKSGIGRTTKVVLSWTAVIVMLIVIFWMSARSGNDLDNNSGIVSMVKSMLANCALALFGHEVDVSPVGHFTEYLLLGAALTNALRFTPWTKFDDARRSGALSKNGHASHPSGMLGDFPAPVIAALISSFYGVTDEFHQIFTPTRSCDPADWLVDTCAAAIGAAIIWAFLKKSGEKD